MAGVRDHDPIILEEFNGWWNRGDAESAPSDHFVVAENVQYFNSGVETRIPLDKYQPDAASLKNVRRIYNYVMQAGQSLLILTIDPLVLPLTGKIYHTINGGVQGPGPILTIVGMEDFGFVAIAGRAYITPFHSVPVPNKPGDFIELGLPGEFVYVYKGDGVVARKAAGPPAAFISGKPFIAYNSSSDGVVTKGIHIVAVSLNGGQLGTQVFPVAEVPEGKQIQVENIPVLGAAVRTLVMTKAIDPKDYKLVPTVPYTYYTVEVITDSTVINRKINIKDADLVSAFVPTAGAAPGTDALTVSNTDIDGFCDFGFHLVAVVYETDTGYLTKPGPVDATGKELYAGQTYIDVKKSVKVTNIPISPSANVVKRHLVSTKAIPEYNGDQKGYQFFFIPKGTLENNTATQLVVNYYDSDLLSDASHLLDNYSEIPAGVNLNTYHNRLVLVGDPSFPKNSLGVADTAKPDNRSVAWLSAPGEPEAINQVDGLVITPLDGNPLTNCQEFRDVLYLFKKNRTYAFSDNFDEPSTWTPEVLDQGVGAPVHGIATVLDSGGVNVDFLVIADWSGLMLFNGTYARPELSWKIESYWASMVRNNFRQIQIINDSLNKKIWMTLPFPYQNHLLFADCANGLDAKSIRWAKWIFNANISCITLIDTDKVILGASETA